MAIILEATYSKKLGLPQYSSHQYSLTVRTELSDRESVSDQSQILYQTLQEAVDREIRDPGFLPGDSQDSSAPAETTHLWQCSDKQRDLILKIVDEHQLDRHKVDQLAQERFGKNVRSLNKMEASGLIDELIETYGRRSGGSSTVTTRRTNGFRRPMAAGKAGSP